MQKYKFEDTYKLFYLIIMIYDFYLCSPETLRWLSWHLSSCTWALLGPSRLRLLLLIHPRTIVLRPVPSALASKLCPLFSPGSRLRGPFCVLCVVVRACDFFLCFCSILFLLLVFGLDSSSSFSTSTRPPCSLFVCVTFHIHLQQRAQNNKNKKKREANRIKNRRETDKQPLFHPWGWCRILRLVLRPSISSILIRIGIAPALLLLFCSWLTTPIPSLWKSPGFRFTLAVWFPFDADKL